MAAMKKLAKFTVVEAGESYNLHIEDEGGQVLELNATRDQVDIIADTLDEILSEDDSADEVEDDEVEGDEGADGKKP